MMGPLKSLPLWSVLGLDQKTARTPDTVRPKVMPFVDVTLWTDSADIDYGYVRHNPGIINHH